MGCNQGFGGNSCLWIIILIFLIFCCGGNGLGNVCGNNCGTTCC